MDSQSKLMISAHKKTSLNILIHFLSGLAGVGLGLLAGIYIGLL